MVSKVNKVLSLDGEDYVCDSGWVDAELEKVSLGDERLDKRIKVVAGAMSLRPMSTINAAHDDWARVKAAYRMFDNKRVSYEKIIKPHIEQTKVRAGKESVILAIQDTTTLSYQGHEKCEGLAIINGTGRGKKKVEGRGILMHSALMVTEEGLPLGLGSLKLYSREEPEKEKEVNAHQKKPITEKESFRWLETMNLANKRFKKKDNRVIVVGDRESDIYEFIQVANELEIEFIVRGNYDRKLKDGQRIRGAVLKEACAGEIEVSVPARNSKKAEKIDFRVFYKELVLSPARRRKGSKWIQLEPQRITVIIATEKKVSKGREAREWMLFTNTEVRNFQEALTCIHRYQQRWQIEIFHKVLKSGCEVEDCRLENVKRICNYISLNCIIAWRIYWCTHINRISPNEPAEKAFSKAEIEVLKIRETEQQKKPVDISTVRQAMRAVAKLGGFLARRWDGLPGPTYLWRGFQVLGTSLDMYVAMTSVSSMQNCG